MGEEPSNRALVHGTPIKEDANVMQGGGCDFGRSRWERGIMGSQPMGILEKS